MQTRCGDSAPARRDGAPRRSRNPFLGDLRAAGAAFQPAVSRSRATAIIAAPAAGSVRQLLICNYCSIATRSSLREPRDNELSSISGSTSDCARRPAADLVISLIRRSRGAARLRQRAKAYRPCWPAADYIRELNEAFNHFFFHTRQPAPHVATSTRSVMERRTVSVIDDRFALWESAPVYAPNPVGSRPMIHA